MSDVTGEVLVLDEFDHDGHRVAVVWMPRPNMLLVQVANIAATGHRHPYELLGFIPRPAEPQLQRNGPYAREWPAEGSDDEKRLVLRAVKTFEAAASPGDRTPKRPVPAG